MYPSYESLRIVHVQTVQEAQDRERIYAELQAAQPARPGLRALISLLRRSFPVRTQQRHAECVCGESLS